MNQNAINPTAVPTAPTAVEAAAPTYLLVHGAWYGAWCWVKVLPLLEAAGHRVVAFDLPSHGQDTTPAETITLADYVRKVVAVAQAQPGPVVLVGHSLASIVNAEAAEYLGPEKIVALVAVDGFVPRDGESARDLSAMATAANEAAGLVPYQPALINSLQFSADYKTSLPQLDRVGELLCHDCSAADIELTKERMSWQAMGCLAAPAHVTDARYGVIPQLYILCTEARELDKRFMATHVPGRVVKLASSHSPFFSMPEQLAAAIPAYAATSADAT